MAEDGLSESAQTVWTGALLLGGTTPCRVRVRCTSSVPPARDLSSMNCFASRYRITVTKFLTDILPLPRGKGSHQLPYEGVQSPGNVFQPCFLDVDEDGGLSQEVWRRLGEHLRRNDCIAIANEQQRAIAQCSLFLFLVPTTAARTFCSFPIPQEQELIGIFYWADNESPHSSPADVSGQTMTYRSSPPLIQSPDNAPDSPTDSPSRYSPSSPDTEDEEVDIMNDSGELCGVWKRNELTYPQEESQHNLIVDEGTGLSESENVLSVEVDPPKQTRNDAGVYSTKANLDGGIHFQNIQLGESIQRLTENKNAKRDCTDKSPNCSPVQKKVRDEMCKVVESRDAYGYTSNSNRYIYAPTLVHDGSSSSDDINVEEVLKISPASPDENSDHISDASHYKDGEDTRMNFYQESKDLEQNLGKGGDTKRDMFIVESKQLGLPSNETSLPIERPSSLMETHIERPSSPMEMHIERPSSPMEMHIERPSSSLETYIEQPSSPIETYIGRPSSPMEMSSKQPSPPPMEKQALRASDEISPPVSYLESPKSDWNYNKSNERAGADKLHKRELTKFHALIPQPNKDTCASRTGVTDDDSSDPFPPGVDSVDRPVSPVNTDITKNYLGLSPTSSRSSQDSQNQKQNNQNHPPVFQTDCHLQIGKHQDPLDLSFCHKRLPASLMIQSAVPEKNDNFLGENAAYQGKLLPMFEGDSAPTSESVSKRDTEPSFYNPATCNNHSTNSHTHTPGMTNTDDEDTLNVDQTALDILDNADIRYMLRNIANVSLLNQSPKSPDWTLPTSKANLNQVTGKERFTSILGKTCTNDDPVSTLPDHHYTKTTSRTDAARLIQETPATLHPGFSPRQVCAKGNNNPVLVHPNTCSTQTSPLTEAAQLIRQTPDEPHTGLSPRHMCAKQVSPEELCTVTWSSKSMASSVSQHMGTFSTEVTEETFTVTKRYSVVKETVGGIMEIAPNPSLLSGGSKQAISLMSRDVMAQSVETSISVPGTGLNTSGIGMSVPGTGLNAPGDFNQYRQRRPSLSDSFWPPCLTSYHFDPKQRKKSSNSETKQESRIQSTEAAGFLQGPSSPTLTSPTHCSSMAKQPCVSSTLYSPPKQVRDTGENITGENRKETHSLWPPCVSTQMKPVKFKLVKRPVLGRSPLSAFEPADASFDMSKDVSKSCTQASPLVSQPVVSLSEPLQEVTDAEWSAANKKRQRRRSRKKSEPGDLDATSRRAQVTCMDALFLPRAVIHHKPKEMKQNVSEIKEKRVVISGKRRRRWVSRRKSTSPPLRNPSPPKQNPSLPKRNISPLQRNIPLPKQNLSLPKGNISPPQQNPSVPDQDPPTRPQQNISPPLQSVSPLLSLPVPGIVPLYQPCLGFRPYALPLMSVPLAVPVQNIGPYAAQTPTGTQLQYVTPTWRLYTPQRLYAPRQLMSLPFSCPTIQTTKDQ